MPERDDWDQWDLARPTGWEDLGPLTVTEEWHSQILDALEVTEDGRRVLGENVHPGGLALELLPRLSRRFPRGEPRDRTRQSSVMSMHLKQTCRLEAPVRVGESLTLLGRIADKIMVDGRPRDLISEAWVLGEDGTPRFFYQQTSRLVEIERAAQK